jgi:hypothetical protein
MLMMPPAPPRPSITNEKATASIIGRSQGSARTQPNSPVPPRRRPAISTDATIVNTESSVGTVTIAVIAACTNLKPAPTCGSANRWWMPIGIEKTRKSTKATRPIVSL